MSLQTHVNAMRFSYLSANVLLQSSISLNTYLKYQWVYNSQIYLKTKVKQFRVQFSLKSLQNIKIMTEINYFAQCTRFVFASCLHLTYYQQYMKVCNTKPIVLTAFENTSLFQFLVSVQFFSLVQHLQTICSIANQKGWLEISERGGRVCKLTKGVKHTKLEISIAVDWRGER